MSFKKTERQVEATKLLASIAKFIMLYGGSRSGKTAVILRAMIIRACKVKSRHIAIRRNFNHIKTSIWLDTFPKVLDLAFPELDVTMKMSDHYAIFPNGSEFWFAGLDDKKRTEKILGNEYSTVFFNECSQLDYTSILIALSRLAEKNDLVNKAYFDQNPPHRSHWSYPLFIQKKNPETWEELKDPSKYAHLLMNPIHNLENIDPDYIADILDEMPEQQRMRFRDGIFSDLGEGLIYYAFSREKNVTRVERDLNLPIHIGMDFNVNPMTATLNNVTSTQLRQFDEIWLPNSNTPAICVEIKNRFPNINPSSITIVPDSTGKNRNPVSSTTNHQILRDAGFNVIYSHNPFRVDRYNSMNNLFEKGNYLIDYKCKKTIADYEQHKYIEGTNMPDTTDKSRGHISDAGGYLGHHTHGIKPIMKAKIRFT